jgi:hypothetical protein
MIELLVILKAWMVGLTQEGQKDDVWRRNGLTLADDDDA